MTERPGQDEGREPNGGAAVDLERQEAESGAARTEKPTPEAASVRPVVVHLSGSLRGRTQILSGDRIRIGTGAQSEILFPADREPAVTEHHAELRREHSAYDVVAAPGETVRVNGERVARAKLVTGDLLEIGEGGPVLRFRLHRGPERPYKTFSEAVADCRDCAARAAAGPLHQLWLMLRRTPRELLTQTGPALRALTLVVLVALAAAIVALAMQGWALRQRIDAEASLLRQIGELLEQTEQNTLTEQELERIRADLEAQLAERLGALEERSLDARKIIAESGRSIVLLLGSYGFTDAESGRPLRLAVTPGGDPIRGVGGLPLLDVEGEGPEYERQFTGTAFVASEEGLLLTNRHLARPWEFDPAARALVEEGWQPRMLRFLGYVPARTESFDLKPILAADDVDVAVLCCSPPEEELSPLELSESLAEPGDAVVVLSYPTGIQALLARTDPAFLDSIMVDSQRDLWSVARRLSEGGHIAPLATMGIVGQSSPAIIVYDAETTRGSSGGPVMGADGRVWALNVAVMREFGGSNLGIPAARARPVLDRAGLVRRDEGGAVPDTAPTIPPEPNP
jgi:S1-C subfamily serine protease